jgi:iron complex outermembrane recepter protein
VAAGKRSPGVQGVYTPEAALRTLLAGAGLTFRATDQRTFLVEAPGASPTQLGDAARTPPSEAPAAEVTELSGVTVVGTNIRGVYPSSSPVQIFTDEDIERSGATTTEQFIRKLPQNFAKVSDYAAGTGDVAGRTTTTNNAGSVNGVDLRGLGLGTTLTLLNGRRIGLSLFGQATDVSLIPIAAIERVEVLTDGASAIYGSDAIGGVVNFVLRDDFEGAETTLSYGGVTSGNLRQGGLSQTLGRRWTGGRVVAAYAFHSVSALEIADRDYAVAAGPGKLSPDETRHNLFLTGSQDLTSRLRFDGALGFARRDVKNQNTSFSLSPASNVNTVNHIETRQWFGNAALDYRISDSWRASLQASYAHEDMDREWTQVLFSRVPPTSSLTVHQTQHSLLDVTAKLDGALFTLPGGALRFSAGAGLLNEDFSGTTGVGFAVGRDIGRRTTYAFAEVFAPLVGEARAIPLVRRLELSLAGRYTKYDDTSSPSIGQDFGDSFDPKVGLLWQPIEGLSFRGTYGTSFRAPALTQLDPTGGQFNVATLTVAGQPARVLILSPYPTPNLQPETAKTYTVGLDLRPSVRPSLRISGTYYRISYDDRIASAPLGADSLTNPERYPDAMYRPTSVAQLTELLAPAFAGTLVGPALPGVDVTNRQAVVVGLLGLPNLWIRDSRLRNLALSEQDGFDFNVSDSFDTPAGHLDLNLTVTRILSYQQQAAAASPVITVVDSISFPTDLRGRFSATLSRGPFTGTLGLNYTDDYRNQRTATDVDEWITADLSLSYRFEGGGALGGVRLNLSVQNLFDEDPPLLHLPASDAILNRIGFDPSNANPLGRLVVLSVTKSW